MAELAYRLTGSSDLYEMGGRRPYASINFVTAHDGFTLADLVVLQRQAQRGQRRGQPRRHRRQLLLELRRRGPDRRSRDRRAPRAAEAELPGHPPPLPGRADAAGRRRDRPHPAAATTTPTARTTSCPGSTGRPPRPAARLLDFTRRLIRLRRDQPGLPPAHVLPGPAHPRLGGQGPRLVPPRRQGDDRRGVAATASAAASACGWPATPSRRWTTWASPSSATPS